MWCKLALISIVTFTSAVAMTTMPPVTTTMDLTGTGKILYDMKHHKAMVVRINGCYEYAMNHDELLQSQNDALRPALEVKIIAALDAALNFEQSGHHHIDHMTEDIRNACANLPIFHFEVPDAAP